MNRFLKNDREKPGDVQNKPERKINAGAIALSLLLAFGLWLYVVAAESPSGQRVVDSVEVKLTGADTLSSAYGFSVLSGYDTQAEITLRGRQSELNALDEADIAAKIDLSDITSAGSYQKKIQITPPSGMEVVRTSPEYVVVEVDVEKTVSVSVLEPSETYSLPEGVHFKRSYSAQTISVKGPQTVVDKIAGVKCEVDLGEFTENTTKSVPVRFVDQAGNEITDRYLVPSQDMLAITYTLYKEKTVPLVLAVETVLPGEKVTQTVTPSTVTVQGAPDEIDRLTQIVARTVSTDQMQTKTSQFSGTVTLPEGMTSPDGTISYEAQTTLSGFTTKTLSLDLSAEGVTLTKPAGMNVSFQEDQLSVTVRTQSAYYSQITSSSLLASIDLSSYTAPGVYSAEVEVFLVPEQEQMAYVLGTVTVNVTLSK